MTRILKLALLLAAPLTVGCDKYPEVHDYGGVCVSSEALDGQLQLTVEANTADCAADHKGATFECSITIDGLTARVETEFQDGKDPNDACDGPLQATCEITVDAGAYTIEFADDQGTLLVPNGPTICLGDAPTEETTGTEAEAEAEGGW